MAAALTPHGRGHGGVGRRHLLFLLRRHLLLLRLLLPATVLLLPAPAAGQTFYRAAGTVVDARTGEALAAANIRVLDSGRGTIANVEGGWLLRLPAGETTLVFSHIGFLSDTLRVDLQADLTYHARLEPTLIEMPVMWVSAGDIARGVVRRAIEAKETIYEGLESYRFEAFTRRTIMREDSIAGLTEGYNYGYWRTGEPLREELRQYRATENLPDELSEIQGVLAIVDFSRDDLELAGSRYVGPLHPHAFRYYDYELESIVRQDGIDIYRIALLPRTNLVPLLAGTISIADSTWALVGVEVESAEPIVFPFIDEFVIRWQQNFSRWEQGYWLPADIRLQAGLLVKLGPIRIPRIGLDQTSVIYAYDLNVPIPDSIFAREEPVTELPGSARVDSLFWQRNEVLPLTAREEHAYTRLDSTQTLDRQFSPRGFHLETGDQEATLRGEVGGAVAGYLFRNLDARYTRVEGTFLGLQVDVDSLLTPGLEAGGRGGYALSAGRWWWEGSLTGKWGGRSPGPNQSGSPPVTVTVDVYDRLARSPEAGFYPGLLNTVTTMLFKDDYFDYHAARGVGLRGEVTLAGGYSRPFRLAWQAARERHTSLAVVTNWSVAYPDKASRDNPAVAVEDARWTRLGAALTLGQPESPAGVNTARGIRLSGERGSTPDGGGRSYTSLEGAASYAVPTFTSRFLFSPQLILRAAGGWSRGDRPRELWFGPVNALGFYGPFGSLRGAGHREFAGDRYAVLCAEHNFRNLPLLALGLRCLARTGLEIIAHGAVARSWRGGIALPANGPYAEAGFGLGRVWDLFRLDLTRRFTAPAGWYLTLALTTFM